MTNSRDTPDIVLGIDPGLTGAIAVSDGTTLYNVLDMSVTRYNGKNVLNVHVLQQYFSAVSHEYGITHAYIERAQSAPGQGAAAAFSYGMGYGQLLASLVAARITYVAVSPTRWKRLAHLPVGANKKASLEMAKSLFERRQQLFARQKDHGRAEAAIIAHLGAKGEL